MANLQCLTCTWCLSNYLASSYILCATDVTGIVTFESKGGQSASLRFNRSVDTSLHGQGRVR